MSKKLEEIFSVDRLRRTWAGKASPSGDEQKSIQPKVGDRPLTAYPSPLVVFEDLTLQIRKRYSGMRGMPFEPLLNELGEKLRSRFPDASGISLPEEEQDALNSAIEALLDQIEDLAEAMDLTKRR